MSAFTKKQRAELETIIDAEVNRRVAEILGKRPAPITINPAPTIYPTDRTWPYTQPRVWCGTAIAKASDHTVMINSSSNDATARKLQREQLARSLQYIAR